MSTTTATSTTRTITTTATGTTTTSTTGSLHADGRLLLPADDPTLLYPDWQPRKHPYLPGLKTEVLKSLRMTRGWSLTIDQAKEFARI